MNARNLIKKLNNPMFWIGVQTVCLITIIVEFIEKKDTWQHTMFWGVISILLIGLSRMDLEKEKE